MTLPAAVAARIQAFIAAGHTGQIVLDVKDGRIMGARLTEYVHVKTEPSQTGQHALARSTSGALS